MQINPQKQHLTKTIRAFRTGEIDPNDYVDELCDRIEEVNSDIHAFVSETDRRNRLREEISDLTDRFPEADNRPPLFGFPVGVKDIIHVDGLETQAGSVLPPELFAGSEATCIKRLRGAGCLVVGKTVTTEFAGSAPGLTRNPHNLDHTPGGSSSGSAAAVAAGLCPLALGTQTIGSVIRPAAFCGVIGMKPSFGRIPREGVIARSESADHVGIFAQNLDNIRRALYTLFDEWSNKEVVLEDLPSIGVPEGEYLRHASPEARKVFKNQLTILENAGCRVERVTVPSFEEFDELRTRHRRLTRGELAFVHEEWFDDYRSFYRIPLAEAIREGRMVTAGQIAEARASQLNLRKELASVLKTHGLDIWASPAAPGPAPETIQETGSPVMNSPWTHAGVPVVTLPDAVTENGLPLGIQFAAPFMHDEMLLSWVETLSDVL